MTFSMPIYVLLVWGFSTWTSMRLVSKLFSAKFWFFALFSLIWPLGWLSEPNLELLFLEWSLALDPTPFVALGSATSQGLGWKCLIFPRWGTDGSS